MKHTIGPRALRRCAKGFFTWAVVLTIAFALLGLPAHRVAAADHRDVVITGGDLAIDLNDVYMFLDPNDNSRVVMAFDVAGPIAPPENVNAGFFNSSIKFRLQIENTGDAEADVFIDIRFSTPTGPTSGQTATVALSGNRGSRTFTAPTTPGSIAEIAPAPVVTTDSVTGIKISAGLHDDPFFFDLPAEARYRASVLAGQPNLTFLDRARDSFAGYNVLGVVLSVPATRLRGPADVIGLSAITLRQSMTMNFADRDPIHMGPFVPLDRMGIPAINSMFIPFTRRDEYNRASTTDDARGRFAADIRGSLQALDTDTISIAELGRLAVARRHAAPKFVADQYGWRGR